VVSAAYNSSLRDAALASVAPCDPPLGPVRVQGVGCRAWGVGSRVYGVGPPSRRATHRQVFLVRLLFFITLKPRVELYTKSMRLKYEPASEPLHISAK